MVWLINIRKQFAKYKREAEDITKTRPLIIMVSVLRTIVHFFIIPVWNSFLVTLLRALILIIGLLYLVFQIKPDKADINLEIESLTEWRHLYAEAVKIDGFNNLQSLEMNYYPPIEIHLHGCAVDGVPYSVTDSLLIQGNNSDKHQEIAVSISGKFDYVFFQDVTCNVDVWSFAPRTVELSLIGPQEVQLRNCHASIVDRNGRIIHEFGEAELITMTSGDAPYTPDGIQGILTSGKISSDEASKYIDEYKNGIFTIGIKKRQKNVTYLQ